MVTVLNQQPPPLDPLSIRAPFPSMRSTRRATLSSTSTTGLALAHPSPRCLPLRQDMLNSLPALSPDREQNSRTYDRSGHASMQLEVDTTLRLAVNYSSMSPLSASTQGSELWESSETDIDEAIDRQVDDIVPKREDAEEEPIGDIKEALNSESPDTKADECRGNESSTKKKRGRPRKPPPSPSATRVKVAKGRSKTGCLTCRRRKKKCDEAKPSCLNCQKNSVVCEGYIPRELWKSGKERSQEERRVSFAIPRGLPPLIAGVETDMDRRFLDHFVYNLSHVLTLHNNTSNPLKDVLLPMATQHKGLMHSLLALSGSHIMAQKAELAVNQRQDHHLSEALSILYQDIEAANTNEVSGHPGGLIVEDPTMASTIVHCLICISRGSTKGEYRMHMNGAKQLLLNKKESKNPEFQRFILDFFVYHEVSNSLTSLDWRSEVNYDDLSLPDFVFQNTIEPQAGHVVGVIDGLYKYLKKVTALRDTIRARRDAGEQPVVPYPEISQACSIAQEIHEWDSKQEPNTSRWIAAELYRLCTWVYLYRSIQASKPTPKLSAVVDASLDCLRALPSNEPTQCILLMPLFILGCAAFEERQRPDVERGFDNLQAYSNLGNIEPAKRIVRRVWEMMDAGDERSWDWETIMCNMGIDLLLA